MRTQTVVLLSLLGAFALSVRPSSQGTTPPRDPVGARATAVQPTGAGVISGRVVAGDTGAPIQKASVNLTPMPSGARGRGVVVGGVPSTAAPTTAAPSGQGRSAAALTILRARQALTDAQGGFEFTGLPAGNYRVSASPGQYATQYLAMAFGAKAPNGFAASDPGQTIELATGQVFGKAVIVLPRGGVIAGRVIDDNAAPLVRVQVYTLFFPPGSTRGQRTGSGQTDDLGQFRLFGLQAGEYAVVAEARGNTFTSPNMTAEREEDKLGYLTTYYPGTADEGAAQRVRSALGTETGGIEIRVLQGRLFRISGRVTDSLGRPGVRMSGQLIRRTSGGMSSIGGFSTDEQGQFQARNIPSGDFRLTIRQNAPPNAPGTPNAPPQAVEMASFRLTVASDLENIFVTTGPGATINGRVVFEQGPPAQPLGNMRVTATVGSQDDQLGLAAPQPAVVTPQLTFTMSGLFGEYLLRASGPGQFLKSVVAGGEDITDKPREFKMNDSVVITVTTRVSTLEGRVTRGDGSAGAGALVVLFSEDKASWRTNSIRTKQAMAGEDGTFRASGLLAGRYLAVALPREQVINLVTHDSAFFDQIAKDAVPVIIGEALAHNVSLRFTEPAGR